MSNIAEVGRSATVVDDAPERMVEEMAARDAVRTCRSPSSASCTVLAIALTLNQLLNLQLFVGIVFIENRYLYLLAALLLPLDFSRLFRRMRSRRAGACPGMTGCSRAASAAAARLVRVAGASHSGAKAGNTARRLQGIIVAGDCLRS